jgi:hypothetical protein
VERIATTIIDKKESGFHPRTAMPSRMAGSWGRGCGEKVWPELFTEKK